MTVYSFIFPFIKNSEQRLATNTNPNRFTRCLDEVIRLQLIALFFSSKIDALLFSIDKSQLTLTSLKFPREDRRIASVTGLVEFQLDLSLIHI